jgi:hypothetical protein
MSTAAPWMVARKNCPHRLNLFDKDRAKEKTF